MIFVSLRYYFIRSQFYLRECSVSDDGETKSSKLARLSFLLLSLFKRDRDLVDVEEILRTKYQLQGLEEEYTSPDYTV